MNTDDFGKKITLPGKSTTSDNPLDYVVDSRYPTLKVRLGTDPVHYGVINFTVGNIPPGNTSRVVTVEHGYDYVPAFFMAWSYPAGTGSITSNSTYGEGTLEIFLDPSNVVYFVPYTDANNFYIDFLNITGNTLNATNLTGQLRYYILADDLHNSEVTY